MVTHLTASESGPLDSLFFVTDKKNHVRSAQVEFHPPGIDGR